MSDQAELITRSGSTRIALYVSLYFRSGTQNVWSGPALHEDAGRVWQPLMGIGRISALEEIEGTGGEAFALQITANAALHDPARYADYLTALQARISEPIKGQRVDIFWRDWGAPGSPVMGEIALKRRGVMSHYTKDITPESASITLHCEPMLIANRKPVNARLTHADQLARHPGDLILGEVAQLAAGDGSNVVSWKPST